MEYRLCGDALLRRVQTDWLLSNPRTGRHVALDRQAVASVTDLAAGAEEAAWRDALAGAAGHDRTGFTSGNGLWSDPSGLTPGAGDWLAGDALFALLRRHLFLIDPTGDEYRAFLAPLTSVLDRTHLGTLHQRIGQHLLLDKRIKDTWRWWHDQKFAPDGLSLKDGPYKSVQGAFFDHQFGDRDLTGRSVLDYACGNGYYSRKFADCGARVIGIDTDANLIALARRNHGDQVEFHAPAGPEQAVTELERLPAGSIDLIYMGDILLIMLDGPEDLLVRVFAAFRRLLKHDGRLHMMEPNGVFWLAGRYGGEDGALALVPEYRRPVYNSAPTFDRVMARLGSFGFALVGYCHPEVGPGSDPELARWAESFPLWDFMTFEKSRTS